MSGMTPFDTDSLFNMESEVESNPDFLPPGIDLDDIEKEEDLPDGGSVYTIGKKKQKEDEEDDPDFYANLAEKIDSATLSSLASELLEDIKNDRESRSEWENTVNLAYKYLGLKVEEFRPEPFAWACGAFDTTLATTLMNFFALARATLFPPGGPAKVQVEGIPTPEIEDRAERVKLFMNYFLTVMDRPYYSDSDRLILYVGFFGCAFRKVVVDPILEHPTARVVAPQNLIVNNNTTSLLESTRITEEIFLTRREVLIRQREGVYLKSSLPEVAEDVDDEKSTVNKTIKNIEGTKENQNENKSLFKFYESHVELMPSKVKDSFVKDDDDIPRPYIVEINVTTKKICSIRRNWRKNDDKYKRRPCYVHYYYLPGFGLYSIGLAQLLGSNAIVLSTVTRQQLDAGTLKNFPGGVRQRGMRIEENNKACGPSEFLEIETGGAPIQEALMLMPYNEPSSVLAALRKELKDETEQLAGASQQGVEDVGSNTPVGTILSQIEIQNRIPSTILKSMHVSLSEELEILKNLFAEYFDDEPYPFNVPGNKAYVMKEDFSDEVNIIPQSDPNIMTTTQRVLVAEMILKISQNAPQLHDQYEILHRLYESMNVSNIDKILPPKQEVQPLDPVTENSNVMMNKALKAGLDQDHHSHIVVHGAALQQMQQAQPPNQTGLSALVAHIQEHQAMQSIIDMQMMMGIQMPDPQMLQDPQVQNQIALQAAQAVMQQQQQQAAQNPPPPTPQEALIMDVQQRREAAHLKHEEAALRAETEAFKAQSNFESEKAKLEAQKEMAADKNEVTLAIAQMKQPHPLE